MADQASPRPEQCAGPMSADGSRGVPNSTSFIVTVETPETLSPAGRRGVRTLKARTHAPPGTQVPCVQRLSGAASPDRGRVGPSLGRMPAARTRRARAAVRRKRRVAAVVNDLTDAQWLALMEAWGGCAYCGALDSALQRDCVLPISRGGRYTVDNVVPACRRCNASKCNDEVTAWLRRKRLDERAFLERYVEVRRALAAAGQPSAAEPVDPARVVAGDQAADVRRVGVRSCRRPRPARRGRRRGRTGRAACRAGRARPARRRRWRRAACRTARARASRGRAPATARRCCGCRGRGRGRRGRRPGRGRRRCGGRGSCAGAARARRGPAVARRNAVSRSGSQSSRSRSLSPYPTWSCSGSPTSSAGVREPGAHRHRGQRGAGSTPARARVELGRPRACRRAAPSPTRYAAIDLAPTAPAALADRSRSATSPAKSRRAGRAAPARRRARAGRPRARCHRPARPARRVSRARARPDVAQPGVDEEGADAGGRQEAGG